MAGDGLLERRPDAADRRAYRLHLEGRIEAGAGGWSFAWATGRGPKCSPFFDNEERLQLLGLLERVLANLDALVNK